MTAGHFPIEVIEIRETNDNQLYIKSNTNNEPFRQNSETRLDRIVKPYKLNHADRLTKEFIAKLKDMKKNKQKNNKFQQEVFVINGDPFEVHNHNSEEYYDDTVKFLDKTRNEEDELAEGTKLLWRV